VPCIGEVRGKGLRVAVEMVAAGTNNPDPLVAAATLEACRAHGLLIGRGGFAGHVLRVAPPLSVTAEEVDRALDAIYASVEEASSISRT
jgi:4-aminobutyrate aminotransferase